MQLSTYILRVMCKVCIMYMYSLNGYVQNSSLSARLEPEWNMNSIPHELIGRASETLYMTIASCLNNACG